MPVKENHNGVSEDCKESKAMEVGLDQDSKNSNHPLGLSDTDSKNGHSNEKFYGVLLKHLKRGESRNSHKSIRSNDGDNKENEFSEENTDTGVTDDLTTYRNTISSPDNSKQNIDHKEKNSRSNSENRKEDNQYVNHNENTVIENQNGDIQFKNEVHSNIIPRTYSDKNSTAMHVGDTRPVASKENNLIIDYASDSHSEHNTSDSDFWDTPLESHINDKPIMNNASYRRTRSGKSGIVKKYDEENESKSVNSPSRNNYSHIESRTDDTPSDIRHDETPFDSQYESMTSENRNAEHHFECNNSSTSTSLSENGNQDMPGSHAGDIDLKSRNDCTRLEDRTEDGICDSVVMDTVLETPRCDGESESRLDASRPESRSGVPRSDSRPYASHPETHHDGPSQETRLDVPSQETRLDASRPESRLDGPGQETHLDVPSQDTRLEASRPESRLDGPCQETRLDVPSQETRLDAFRPESRLDGPSQETRLDVPSQESHLDASRPESRLDVPSQETRLDVPSQETRLEASRPESRLDSPSQETRLDASRPESRLDESCSEGHPFAPQLESHLNASCPESRLDAPRPESRLDAPQLESLDTPCPDIRLDTPRTESHFDALSPENDDDGDWWDNIHKEKDDTSTDSGNDDIQSASPNIDINWDSLSDNSLKENKAEHFDVNIRMINQTNDSDAISPKKTTLAARRFKVIQENRRNEADRLKQRNKEDSERETQEAINQKENANNPKNELLSEKCHRVAQTNSCVEGSLAACRYKVIYSKFGGDGHVHSTCGHKHFNSTDKHPDIYIDGPNILRYKQDSSVSIDDRDKYILMHDDGITRIIRKQKKKMESPPDANSVEGLASLYKVSTNFVSKVLALGVIDYVEEKQEERFPWRNRKVDKMINQAKDTLQFYKCIKWTNLYECSDAVLEVFNETEKQSSKQGIFYNKFKQPKSSFCCLL